MYPEKIAQRLEARARLRAAKTQIQVVDIPPRPAAPHPHPVRPAFRHPLTSYTANEECRELHAAVDRDLQRAPAPATALHADSAAGAQIARARNHRASLHLRRA